MTFTDPDDGRTIDCIVETEREPGKKTLEAFERLAVGKLPARHVPREEWQKDIDYIAEDNTIRENWIVPMWIMPPGLRSFADELSLDLHRAATVAVGLLRWRAGVLGPPRPFASRGIEWSLDGTAWHPLPSTGSVRVHANARLELTKEAAAELQDLLEAEVAEPLAHELYREAWSLQWDNPRSSMLIAITAMEVGIKQYISACVPGASWLAQHAPTPPVLQMLRDYIPELAPPMGTPTGAIDEDILKEIQKAVSARNALTHRGESVDPKRLGKTLRAVRNLLWTFDEALGQPWVATHRFASLEDGPPMAYRRV